jgi:hypothetical protein
LEEHVVLIFPEDLSSPPVYNGCKSEHTKVLKRYSEAVNLNILKRYSEAVNRTADNKMAKQNRTKGQTSFYIALHRKLKFCKESVTNDDQPFQQYQQ